jgi:stage II sporulation protein D
MKWVKRICLFLLGAALPATAQNTVSVRLYGLHPQREVKITVRTGTLRWRTCERCVANETKELAVRSAGDQVQIEAEGEAGVRADKLFVEGEYRIEPQNETKTGTKIALAAPLEISVADGLLTLVATMPLEDYVAAALQGESANFRHPESLKAMAVAVRTYTARFRPRHGDEGFDFCDNTHCQNLNFTGPMLSVRAAVAATRGELLWYQGSPAATYYHQNCGGTLAAGEEVWPTVHAPYLREHVDPYCQQGAPLPWKAEFSRAEFEKALRDQGLTVPAAWNGLEIVSRGPSGRATKLAFRSPGQDPQLISASTLRFAIGRSFGWNRVRSDLYEVEATAATVAFNGRGAGHGVGLCQAGAEEMARQGQTYRQILAFYYPGTQLGATAQGLNWQKRENGAFELLTTQPEVDSGLLPIAEQALEAAQSDLGWKLDFKVQLRVFPTLDAYRNTTGQPGWIAAYTRGHRISLQPTAVLKDKSILESTLRHEFTHLLVEARAHAGTPLWFREGLVLYFADRDRPFAPVTMAEAEIEAALAGAVSQESLERAYAAARTRVARMVEQYGKEVVLGWLASGLPAAQARPSQR